MHHNEERVEHDSEMMVVTPGDASRLLVRVVCNQRDGNFSIRTGLIRLLGIRIHSRFRRLLAVCSPS
jgi:hypothetical protein